MSFAAAIPWTALTAEDRSLGTVARSLRRELKEAASGGSKRDVHDIVQHILDALRNSETSVSFTTFQKTLAFMISLPTELSLPIVVVESEDEIGLDWDEDPQRVVSLTIDNTDQIGFSALFGREPVYGRVENIDGLPETLRFVLARLYPSAQLH